MQTGVIVQEREADHSDIKPVTESEELEACIEDLMKSISSKDIKQIAEHAKTIHDILHQYMDKESDSSDFDSQNAKAAKDQE